jgi:hypothetical protein
MGSAATETRNSVELRLFFLRYGGRLAVVTSTIGQEEHKCGMDRSGLAYPIADLPPHPTRDSAARLAGTSGP